MKWDCNDFKCLRNPTESRFSLTHWHTAVIRCVPWHRSSSVFNHPVSMLRNSIHVEWRCLPHLCWWWRRSRLFLWRQAVETMPASGRWEKQTVMLCEFSAVNMTLHFTWKTYLYCTKKTLLHVTFIVACLSLVLYSSSSSSSSSSTNFSATQVLTKTAGPLQRGGAVIYQRYNLRHRTHSLQLPSHTTRLSDSNFITRMLYKDKY